MSNPRPLLYNPDQKPKSQLINEFVIRQKEFGMIMKDLTGSSLNTSPQHYLIIGQRGMGKTTLMLRIKYAIEDDDHLNSWMIPLRFNEEQYQIATLDRLWEEIADLLETADNSFTGLLKGMEAQDEAEDYERIAIQMLTGALKKKRKRIVLMVDNLGDLFKKFSDVENHRLREVLISHTEIQLIAASSVVLEHTFSYDKPFFEFFQQITLPPVTRESSLELLRSLGKQYNQEAVVETLITENTAKIETLRRLTGGVPRTVGLLFGIFIDHRKGSTFEDLLLLLDEVNTLYKQRMDDMKPQQQRIVDALAKAWDPISSKEVLKRSKLGREGIETNQIAAQLNVLATNQVVETVSGKGKSKAYRIRERFFNIWYLMRYGKKEHREEVLWLVRFMESWFTRKELKFQANEQVKALQEGGYSIRAAYFKTMALYHTKGIESNQKLELLEQAENYFKLSAEEATASVIEKTKKKELDNCVAELLEKYTANHKLTEKDLPKLNPESTIYIIISIGDNLFKEEESLLGIKSLLQTGIELQSSACMNAMGLAYYDSDFSQAEKNLQLAIKAGNKNAMYNLANLYYNKNDMESAEKYYLMAVEGGDIDAMANLGILYYRKKNDMESAEKYYLMAVEKGNIDAMYNLANLYYNKNDMELAEKYFLMAAKGDDISAMYNLGVLYYRKNDLESAEKYFFMAAEGGNIDAMYNLGVLYNDKNNMESAEKHYLMAAEGGNISAMYNLGVLYNDKNDLESAEKYYLMAIEKNHPSAGNNLARIYLKTNREMALVEKYSKLSHSLGSIVASANLISFYSMNGRTQDMLNLSEELLNRKDVLENQELLFIIIKQIFIKKQYHFLLQQFQKPGSELLKYARPMFYVLAYFMKEELPGEYEKTGLEMKETVDEIIQDILEQQKEVPQLN